MTGDTIGLKIAMVSASNESPEAEEMITHYILPIRPNRADRRKVVPK